MSAKYVQLADLVRHRLERGDYEFCAIPGAQKLAAETGVSYLTARQAIQKLIADGVLRRNDTGRLQPVLRQQGRQLKVALVQPAGMPFDVWRHEIVRTALAYGFVFREVSYCYDDDPLLFDALNGDFDLILLHFNRTDELFIDKLKRLKGKLVTLFQDLTVHGIPMLDGITPSAAGQLVEHFYATGCRHIDCFNTQPEGGAVSERMKAWKKTLKRLGCSGDFLHHPVAHFSPALAHAHRVSGEILDRGGFGGDAVFCISVECAIGLVRSCYERGIAIPERLAVGAFGHLYWARTAVPSITVVDTPDVSGAIRDLFDHFTGVRPQPDRLSFRVSDENCLHIGESTRTIEQQQRRIS